MPKRTPVVIVGAGGFGREVAWLVEEIANEEGTVELRGLLDDGATSTPEGYPVLGTIDEWLEDADPDVRLACAIGDSITRRAMVQRLTERGVKFATLVHPSVRRSRFVEIGEGSIICADCTLTTNVRVGVHVLLNLRCAVGHDSVLGDFTSAMPAVNVMGDVTTGSGVYFGTAATVINGITIGDWTIVGAGATVAGDLPPAVVAVGVPAKPIKANARAPLSAVPA